MVCEDCTDQRQSCHARNPYTSDGAAGVIYGIDRTKRLSQKQHSLTGPSHLVLWSHELTDGRQRHTHVPAGV